MTLYKVLNGFDSDRRNILHLLLVKLCRDHIRSERTLYKSFFYITLHSTTAHQLFKFKDL